MPSVRPISLAVPRLGDHILVAEFHDPTKNLTFYRPLGGGIEFGETAEAALHREMREELGTDLVDVSLLGVLENLFHGFSQDGHEIVFVYDCVLADPRLNEPDFVGEVLDDAGTKVMWRSLGSFSPATPLYPEGLAGLL